ncbi:MAG TPA: hypothetical protein VHH34_23455 [Pseudonocardiaceae bacterium]|nr:hypothetical protein [Pseudonocardiaceae bacterium]
MSTAPAPALPDWQRDRLALLLDAVGDVPISDAERRTLAWLSGWERDTVENVAALISRAQNGTAR